MLLRISHQTHYLHSEPVSYGLMELRLLPGGQEGQKIIDWQVRMEGASEELRFTDQHLNQVILASYAGQPHEILITCEGSVETFDTAGVSGSHKGAAPLWYYKRPTSLTRPGPLVRGLLRNLPDNGGDEIGQMHQLCSIIADSVRYETGSTHIHTTAEDAVRLGSGVCQDHAHVLISAARMLGYPARYVSGYLMMNDRIEQEASHAWAEVHFDGLGWVGFDVSNGISPDERYVRVACGLDYREAAPIRGFHLGGGQSEDNKMLVNIAVQQ